MNFIKNVFRFHLVNPLRFLWDKAIAPCSFKILLLSDNEEFTSEQQFEPFYTYRSLLRDKVGCVFQHALIENNSVDLQSFDCIGLKVSFKRTKQDVLRIVKELFVRKKENTPLIYFDGDDDLGVQHPELLPFVTHYIKKHLHADSREYLKSRIGKSHLTDYVAKTYNVSFFQDPIPQSSPLKEAEIAKLYLGWNLALDRRIFALYQKEKHKAYPQKTLDIVYRATIPNDWIRFFRSRPKEILQTLESQFSIRIPTTPVPLSEYYQEMRSSRLCISPFGYGEICWRDFEAVILRSLLMKPDVSHLKTIPNIFIPYETYVPLKWDYSDLEEKSRFYLAHPEERIRIVNNAYQKLSDYYENKEFLSQVQELVSLLKCTII